MTLWIVTGWCSRSPSIVAVVAPWFVYFSDIWLLLATELEMCDWSDGKYVETGRR